MKPTVKHYTWSFLLRLEGISSHMPLAPKRSLTSLEAWTPGCRHHCSFPSPCLASPHLKSVWPSRRRNHGGGQGPLSTTTIALPSWKGKSSGATATLNSHWHKSVSPQHRSLQPHTRCAKLHTSTWAGGGLQLGAGGVGAVLASLAHSQLVGRTGRKEEVLWVIRSSQWDKCPLAVIPWCQ